MKEKADKKIKVALIAPSMSQLGGQSIQARRLLEAFEADEEIELTFIPNNPENFGQNVKFLRTATTSLKFWFSLLKTLRKAEIAHVFSSGTTSYLISTLPALYAAKFYGVKTILHYHTGEAETHLKNWKKSAQTMRMFDRIVAPSQFLVDVFARFNLRAQAIFNFVETEKFKFRVRQPLNPVFFSNRNFESHYQVGDVLRAFAVIQEKFSNARLIIVGAGSEEAALKKLAEELQLKNTEFAGRVEQEKMPEFYDRADVYLNSSIVDNMPLSIIEAFSCGLPVISTNAGGIPYIVTHEETGLLVNANDYESLAEQAVRLFEDKELAQKIIAKARAECVKYSWDEVRKEWVEIYEELARDKSN